MFVVIREVLTINVYLRTFTLPKLQKPSLHLLETIKEKPEKLDSLKMNKIFNIFRKLVESKTLFLVFCNFQAYYKLFLPFAY